MFLNDAKGSAGELRTQIDIGMDIGYIDKEIGKHWLAEAENNLKNAPRPNQINPRPHQNMTHAP